MFLSKHRLNIALLRIGKHRIIKNIASLRKVKIAHPYSNESITHTLNVVSTTSRATYMGSTLTFMLTETELHSHLPTCCTVWVPAPGLGSSAATTHSKLQTWSGPEHECNWCRHPMGGALTFLLSNPVVPPVVPHPICRQVWIPHLSQQHRPRDAADHYNWCL